MNARANRGVGKSDPLDARRIAQAALPLDHTQLRLPRTDEGARAALRILIASRDPERQAALFARMFGAESVTAGPEGRHVLKAGEAVVEVRAPDGRPLEGAEVYVFGSVWPAQAVTGADGRTAGSPAVGIS